MDKIENTNNLTLAQLIEIWEICNNTLMNCKKCPLNKKNRAKSDDETLNNTDCIEILHTATLEALKNLVQLVDFQKEENERLNEENKKVSAYIGNGWGYVSFLEFIKSQKTEAIKELLDKIEKQAIPIEDDVYWVELDDIYNLVKEMAGDTE